MISSIALEGTFPAVPYLQGSQLMETVKGSIKFSKTKPNIIVGPNGSGKSALMKSLALRTMSFYGGCSAFDDKYLKGVGKDVLWSRDRGWGDDWEYCKALNAKTDEAPALYYHPGFIIGDDCDFTHAFCAGYSRNAFEMGDLVKDKSSGQAAKALLERSLKAIRGQELPDTYEFMNWRCGEELRDLRKDRHPMDWDVQAEMLKKKIFKRKAGVPVVLLDEPEQSMDALSELQFWKDMEKVDCAAVQVIAATHSLYPILHPEAFNIIEAVPGYMASVRALA